MALLEPRSFPLGTSLPPKDIHVRVAERSAHRRPCVRHTGCERFPSEMGRYRALYGG